MSAANADERFWPPLVFSEWKETCATLHMWTQIVGKVRLALSPWTNHSWHVTLYLTARGLTTSPIYCGRSPFEIEFDFEDHKLRVITKNDAAHEILLESRSVASFYKELMQLLDALGIQAQINVVPNEVADPIRFDRDESHRSYDPEYANRFWRVLLQSDRVFKQFRAEFCGKCSPVHFFWGSFDLAVTRFSGRRAPRHPGGVPHLPDAVTREAYSHEVSSLGFWPGNEMMPEPIFYSYAYPQPEGFPEAKVLPAAASFNAQLKEFVLPYEAVRQSGSPDQALLDFARSTYDAASTLAKWDRDALVEIKPDLHSPRQHR
jgi:hypothetical protein